MYLQLYTIRNGRLLSRNRLNFAHQHHWLSSSNGSYTLSQTSIFLLYFSRVAGSVPRVDQTTAVGTVHSHHSCQFEREEHHVHVETSEDVFVEQYERRSAVEFVYFGHREQNVGRIVKRPYFYQPGHRSVFGDEKQKYRFDVQSDMINY